MFVNVGIFSAVILMDAIKAFDGDGFGTFHTIKGEKPTLAATQAVSDPEVTIKLDFQCCPVHLYDKDAILQEQNKGNGVLVKKLFLDSVIMSHNKTRFLSQEPEFNLTKPQAFDSVAES